MTTTTNKYLEKIAALHFPVINPIRTVNPIKGLANTVSKGGVKGSVFGRTMKPGNSIEKIAMNRGSKEMLLKFKNPDTGFSNMAYHMGYKLGKSSPSEIKGAAKAVSRMHINGSQGSNHLGGDTLGEKLGLPLSRRIEHRNPELMDKLRSSKKSLPPPPPKFPW